jgi:hypothetical protein
MLLTIIFLIFFCPSLRLHMKKWLACKRNYWAITSMAAMMNVNSAGEVMNIPLRKSTNS